LRRYDLVASALPQEMERGARCMAFVTSFHDLPSVKLSCLHKGALPLLLRLLCPVAPARHCPPRHRHTIPRMTLA